MAKKKKSGNAEDNAVFVTLPEASPKAKRGRRSKEDNPIDGTQETTAAAAATSAAEPKRKTRQAIIVSSSEDDEDADEEEDEEEEEEEDEEDDELDGDSAKSPAKSKMHAI
jgi:hypothetical protein